MIRSVSLPTVLAALVGLATFGWTGSGVSRTTSVAAVAVGGVCDGVACPIEARGFQTHWVSHTGNGQLYVMVRSDCRGSASDCLVRFVERTATGVATRLDVQGEFRVVHNGKPVPDVEALRRVSESETEVTRYSWLAGAYARSETRQIFHVDGESCGTALECYQKAQAAREGRDTGKALQILETVHRVSYI
jgi:hypothetical protein